MEMERQEEAKRRRLVLVPCPYQGHINPMLQLANILYSKGFRSITIAHTIFNSPNPSNHPNFTFIPIPDNLSDTRISFRDAVAAILRVNANCPAPLAQILSQMMGGDDGIACVIFDEMMFYVHSVVQSLNIPSIVLRTNNAATLLGRHEIFNLNKQGCIPLPDSMMEETVPGHYPLRYKDLPYPKKSKAEGEFWELITNMSNIKSSSAMVINTIDLLEHEELIRLKQYFRAQILPISPLHKLVPPAAPSSSSLIEEDESCIQWLDTQETNSVLYISLGSIVSMGENDIEEMAWGLVNSKQPFLWVIRPDYSAQCSLPEGLNGKIVKWAPQKEVLAHRAVGGFWSHAGWNSTLESISEGVPMICMPEYADQFVDSRYLSVVWKVGLVYEEDRVEKGKVEKLVKRVMVEKEGEELRQRAKELKKKVEACIQPGGSSYNYLNQLVELIMSF